MEISSCGSAANISNYFAYIVGQVPIFFDELEQMYDCHLFCRNDLCNVATEFFCHVFYAGDQEVACTILQSIGKFLILVDGCCICLSFDVLGQGFHRTHFAV